MTTSNLIMSAYVLARKAKTPIVEQTPHERAGRFLLLAASKTHDGEANPRVALKIALREGEVDAALRIYESLVAPPQTEADKPLTPEVSHTVSGEFTVDFSV